jgi:hypothetical protein
MMQTVDAQIELTFCFGINWKQVEIPIYNTKAVAKPIKVILMCNFQNCLK